MYLSSEACEYTNSFLHFFPKIGIILNVEEDHMDFFKDIDDIRNSFHQFAALLPADGALVINQNIEGINSITDGLDCKIITYSERQPADYSASEIRFDEIGNASFDLLRHGEYVDRITLAVAGTTMYPMHLPSLLSVSSSRFHLYQLKKGFCRSPERTAVSNIKGSEMVLRSSMIMRIIQRRSARH